MNVIAAGNKSGNSKHKLLRDTIIKLDPNSAQDRKLMRGIKKAAPKPVVKNNGTKKDTIPKDTTKRDSTKKSTLIPGAGTLQPGGEDTTVNDPDGLKSEVKATAEDSTIFDKEKNIMYLYGRARVTYEDFELDADYIRVDNKNNTIFAAGSINPRTHRYQGRPISKQKNDKPLYSDSLRFNMKSKKGKIYNPASEQDGNFISGGQAKKLNETEVAYRNVLFSTCDLPYPETHFGIVITKGIGEKNKIISGPAYLEIANVPLPLAIPFGFFPKPNTRSSGVILPTFGEDQRYGFFLRNLGYYIAFNDYLDMTFNGSFYSRGSYELSGAGRYLKRYKYQGNLTLSYGSHNIGLPGDPAAKDFNIAWTHSQDPNAHPGSTFSASVNAGTSSNFINNGASQGYNLQQLTQNNFRSSIAYGKVWAGTPFNLNVSLSHSQDITRKRVTLDLPTVAFNMSTLSPLDSKDRVGEAKWYQKITVGYSFQATNKLNDIPEADLFTKQTLTKRLQNGFQHQIPIGLSLNVLKFFQFSTSANYNERWYLQTIRKSYDRNNTNVGSNVATIDTVSGFARSGEYNLSAGFSTKVYSQANFKGKISAIRHVMTPNLSFSYKPDFSSPGYGYYRTAVSNASLPYTATAQTYSIFEQSIYGGPSAGRQAGIGFNVDNTIEAKLRPSATDTSNTPRKIQILQGLSFSTFYNFAADSMRLSKISFSGHTAFLNQKVNVSFNGLLNPYVVDVRDSISNGAITRYSRERNRFTWQDGKFPKLESFGFSMSGSLNSTSINPKRKQTDANTIQNMTPEQAQKLAYINSDPSAYIDFNIPWNVSFSYNFQYQNSGVLKTTTNTIQMSGDFSLTPKWKVQYSTNYDLNAMKLSSATSFAIYRDLHCWDLSVQWLPFGYFKSYNVTIKVKSSILQDLKLTKRSDYSANQYFGGY
ncbi:putative LPS assembly protein LptD [Mucilaginibacter gynuensis]|uniref:LPS assembly protein LptD n=1 Tax=Mucilaginibacter gynuensis TaxID=1302236 RepID=A0ABP8FRS2_9SPHI